MKYKFKVEYEFLRLSESYISSIATAIAEQSVSLDIKPGSHLVVTDDIDIVHRFARLKGHEDGTYFIVMISDQCETVPEGVEVLSAEDFPEKFRGLPIFQKG